ncbi:hypothetical protein ACIOZL_38250 [Streptomyces sp. NPDC087769]|uniref:hypothetical protein n=1 Tax=Streptomyces sp. NPDC087769 TaxID=3365802 RepID=UPI00380F0CCF
MHVRTSWGGLPGRYERITPFRTAQLSAELLRAARDGLRGERTDPRAGRLSPADGLVPSPAAPHRPGSGGDRRPATGDRETVVALLRRLAARGAARAR